MSRPPDVGRRAALLAAVVDTCGERGVGQRSLRDIAVETGTSHRMLIHHFGSREGLLVAVVQEVEARQVAIAGELAAETRDVLAAMWEHLSDPALRASERLFFECYARGANGEQPFDRLLPDAVDAWLRPTAPGADAPDPELTRLSLAVVRGLLLDLVATGAGAETTAALHRFTALVAAAHRTGDAVPVRQES